MQKGKAQYYPMNPSDNENNEYNPRRPTYTFDKLPLCSQSEYWNTISELSKAKTKKNKKDITKKTSVVALPLCATSLVFIHSSFFLLDPFHLFYENCMAFL